MSRLKKVFVFGVAPAVIVAWAFVLFRLTTYTFPIQKLLVGDHEITVQLADTPARRQHGLMWQDPIRYDGMILVFDEPQKISLWMKNTPTPLDVAFIGPDWTIIGFAQMEPYSEDEHWSPEASIAALEVPQGWFGKMQITVGAKIVVEK